MDLHRSILLLLMLSPTFCGTARADLNAAASSATPYSFAPLPTNGRPELAPRRSPAAAAPTNQKGSHPVLKAGFVIASVVGGAFAARQTARWIYPGEADKEKHAIAGELASVLGTAVGIEAFHWNTLPSCLLGVLTATAAGAAKEFYDSRTGGDVSRRDVLATMAGGGVGAVAGASFAVRF